MPDLKNFRERLAGKLFPPKGDHVPDSRSNERADNQPKSQVDNLFCWHSHAHGPAARGPQAGSKTQCHHHAIPADQQRAKIKSYRMHIEKANSRRKPGNHNAPPAKPSQTARTIESNRPSDYESGSWT